MAPLHPTAGYRGEGQGCVKVQALSLSYPLCPTWWMNLSPPTPPVSSPQVNGGAGQEPLSIS